MAAKDHVKALVFDVFGTVVDWRGSVSRELTAFGNARGLKADWVAFADDWRGLYQPAMDEVRSGRREFTILDTLHRENLLKLVDKYDLKGLAEHEIEHLNTIWHRLDPWPDVVEGLTRLKRRYIIGPCSNANIGLAVRMAKRAGLPWDVIVGAEVARAFKPTPEAYLRSAAALNLQPHEVMLVAAHNNDLAAAAKTGFRTAFVHRPDEYGSRRAADVATNHTWDIATDSFIGVAEAMGCPRR
jgi:2-haloacid dehalogenase